ncbi:MAG: hypothetical protein LBC59_00295 [Chitinispirillales bacterium]|jgi:hypothetical protein|nr:hypothetical protein [Chitinispirillales bacterium]
MTKDMADVITSICKVILDRANNKAAELDSVASWLERERKKLEELELREKYFFNSLKGNAAFENLDEFKTFRKCLPKLAMMYKRIFVIINTLRDFLEKNSLCDVYGLNKKALLKVAKCYLDDLSVLKKRYGSKTVQLPKIAGLMTNLIVKYRPVVPLKATNDPSEYVNEIFAIYHALCICSDFSDGDELAAFENTADCSEFYTDMRYLLNRNYTPESLIMVFKTLCLCRFPSFLNRDVDG